MEKMPLLAGRTVGFPPAGQMNSEKKAFYSHDHLTAGKEACLLKTEEKEGNHPRLPPLFSEALISFSRIKFVVCLKNWSMSSPQNSCLKKILSGFRLNFSRRNSPTLSCHQCWKSSRLSALGPFHYCKFMSIE